MIDVITSSGELEQLAAEWEALWRESPAATPFQSPQWLIPWWRHFGSDSLFVVTVRNEGQLTALAPCSILRDEDSGDSLGIFLGTGISDHLDILGGSAEAAESIAGAMTGADCAMWDLHQLPPGSPLLETVWPAGWSTSFDDGEPCPVLDLETFDDVEQVLPKQRRKQLRYYERAAHRIGELRREEATSDTLDAMLDSLFDLHTRQWKHRGLPGLLGDATSQSFHREVAAGLLDAGALRLFSLSAGDRVMAVFYGFAHQGTISYYLSGYDPDLAKVNPGTLMIASAIRAAIAEGAHAFDFLRGAERYKYDWRATDRRTIRMTLLRSSA